jgi:two-component system cell cycle sensor histidine kinase/response regulator CckA
MTKARILVVEDESIVAEDIRVKLGGMGYPVVGVASSGSEAIALAEKLHPDLVLMDIQLPGAEDGVATAQEIAKHSDIAVVYLTAFADPETLARAKLTGPFGYIVKPFTQTELQSAIEIAHYKHQMERTVREQAAWLDKAQDAILVIDLEDRFDYWNKSAERLYGWPASEALGKSIGELLNPSGSGRQEEARRRVLQEGEWSGELPQVSREGRVLLIQSRWTLLRNGAGQAQKILIVNTDLTAQKQLEAKFLRAQRLESLGTLATGIAHDLNNVLAPIVMALQYLRETNHNADDQTMLATLEASALRGANIVKQVLTFARGIEGDRIVLQPKYLIKEIAQIARETFPKSITVRANYPANLWALSGDATQLQQVLINLCVNARDAMPKGGTLNLNVENVQLDEAYAHMNLEAKPGPYVVVTVSDTGHGIAPEHMERIFEPFFTTKGVGKGSGLGLSTALGIVKSHGGFIQLKSQLGEGTHFKIFLPATKVETAQTRALPPEVLPSGQGELILVVDDEKGIQDIARQTLEKHGYRVLTAGDGTEAVALYAQSAKDIKAVMVDMVMPYLDGPATIRALRSLKSDVRVIASSGAVTPQKEAEARNNGVQAFLPKPFTAEVLVRTLQDVLAKPA